jgi:hypothetical protein
MLYRLNIGIVIICIISRLLKIMTRQKKIIFASVVISAIVSFGMVQTQIFAEETDEIKYTKASEIAIHTVFTFRQAVETSDSFQVFKQVSGFDRESESPSFKLEGIMDYNRAHLYEAADVTFQRGDDTQHNYGQFDVDVYLQQGNLTLRHFQYEDCNISDYKVDTLFDKEEGWNSNKGFATIDIFEFECSGYKPNNPVMELLKSTYDVKGQSSLDLRNTQTWSDVYK